MKAEDDDYLARLRRKIAEEEANRKDEILRLRQEVELMEEKVRL